MTTKYAKPISRIGKWDKGEIERAAEKFFDVEVVVIEKVFKNYAVSTIDEDKQTAQPVRTPCCNVIDVIWGEYGDPEIEGCICPKCGEVYTGEPF